MSWNKEQSNNWQREYYQKRKNDPDYLKRKREAAKKYYEKNKDKCLLRGKKYFKDNKEKYNKYRREYRYNNPIGIYSVIKDGVKKNGSSRRTLLKISKEDFVKWYNEQEKVCFYCGRTLEEIKKEDDRVNRGINRFSIDRTDNKKGYEIGNMVLSCMRCNAIKSDYFTKEEMLLIGRIIHDKNS